MNSRLLAIQVENLSKIYAKVSGARHLLQILGFVRKKRDEGGTKVIKDISFTLERGSSLGIIGRNGAGKSTLLQMVSGVVAPSSGRVITNGRVAAILELGAGFNLFLTGRENIGINASIYGISAEELKTKEEKIIAFADIGDYIDQPINTYSSGMLVRLAFSIIANIDADILIIDEALAVGDTLFSQKCMRFLEVFQKQGGTVLFVSHDIPSVTRLCDRALWIEKGVVKGYGDAKEITENYLDYIYSLNQVTVEKEPVNNNEKLNIISIDKVDIREQIINESNLRNDIKIFDYTADSFSFGDGGADIIEVYIESEDGKALSHAVGGQIVNLVIVFKPNVDLKGVIIGYLLKNSKGQVLFGDNNCLLKEVICGKEAHIYRSAFKIKLPYLPLDEYFITAAIASGTQNEHIQHCWHHDALRFHVLSSPAVHGLMGVPLLDFCCNQL